METSESQIEGLKRRADERETMRYPQSFREDAVKVVSRLRVDGFTQNVVSELLEIPWVMLARKTAVASVTMAPAGVLFLMTEPFRDLFVGKRP